MNKKQLIEDLTEERISHEKTKKESLFHRKIANTYWDRWRFELDERIKLIVMEKQKMNSVIWACEEVQIHFHISIDHN